jgi:hypothetical protein
VDDLWFADNNAIKQDWFLQQALAILDNIDELEIDPLPSKNSISNIEKDHRFTWWLFLFCKLLRKIMGLIPCPLAFSNSI